MEPQTADLHTSHDIRVLDAHGVAVAHTEHGTNWATAFENFTQTAMDSEPGYTVQLITNGAVAEEYITGEGQS